ncbi:adhesion G-protein coupled receptor G1-like [Anabas testudineus]|uniref:Adhesion G protein-coupled receptor G3 n=1 Tax=Anabas testudineus TaxID=64144 RepID=A0A3Q1HTQ5_ANATE|nr:adhesion G-protein coupled receptor G1-like [Anabas testudineus]
MRWIVLCLVTLGWFSAIHPAEPLRCDDVPNECHKKPTSWTRCFENNIATCIQGRKPSFPIVHEMVNFSSSARSWAQMNLWSRHHVHIPWSALRKIGKAASEMMVVASVIDSTHFKLAPPNTPRQGRMKGRIPNNQPARVDGIVMEGSVLAVKAGNQPVSNLTQPINLIFNYNHKVENGTCVFWHEPQEGNGTGYWSTEGCDTSVNETAFICSCNHLSFFAVLVNPVLTVDESNSTTLSYITYIGSALSVLFAIITLIVYICLQRRRPEKAIGVHMQLTGALLCLHLSFLLSSFWAWRHKEEDLMCRALGLILHWSLLASISWMALEGFHLYLLLVRVFNIYVRRYLLKLSLVGWGVPTLTAVICGISGVYGNHSLDLRDSNQTSTMCWIKSSFPQTLVSYITIVAFSGLVILCNSCMLGVVVLKLRGLREDGGGSSSWNKMNKEKGTRLWKDCATVVGLSCVLGLPWGLAATTYISLPGIYIFTILNSLQGVFIFLWCLALTCKSRDNNNSSVRDPSTQKMMMTTSFNN